MTTQGSGAVIEVTADEAARNGLPPIAIRIDAAGTDVAVHRFWRPWNYVTVSRTDERPGGKVTMALSIERVEGASTDLAAIERALRARALDMDGRAAPVTLGRPGEVVVGGVAYQALAVGMGDPSYPIWSICCGTLIPTAQGPLLVMMSVDPMPPGAGILPCSAVATAPLFERLLRGLSIAQPLDQAPMHLAISAEDCRAHGLPPIALRVDATGTGMLGALFSFRNNYLHLRSPDADTTFTVSRASEAATDLAAIERAVHGEFNFAGSQPVTISGAGELWIAGALRAALAFSTGPSSPRGRFAWCGTLIAIAQGSVLVVMGGQTPQPSVTCAELLARPVFEQLVRTFALVDHARVSQPRSPQIDDAIRAFQRAATPLDQALYQLSSGLVAVGATLARVIAGQQPIEQLPAALVRGKELLAAARSALLAISADAELVRLADGRAWQADAILRRLGEAPLAATELNRLEQEFLEHQRAHQLEMSTMASVVRDVAELVDGLVQGVDVSGASAVRLRRLQALLASSETHYRWSTRPERGFAASLARHARVVDDLLARLDAGTG